MFNYYNTADEIAGSDIDTVILPIGSTEQHGAHLPIGTDVIIAEAVARGICKQMEALVLPTLPISTCSEHRGKKGSVWMKADTFYYVIRDIVECLREQGFKRIVILTAHGGIFIAGPVIRDLNAKYDDIKVIRVALGELPRSKEMEGVIESSNNLHACESETSLMLFLEEEYVKMDKAIDYIPDVPRPFLNYESIFKFSSNGVWGTPSLGTKEKGKKLYDYKVKEAVKYIKETFKYLEKLN
jgi:creatinine amidohydrolase